MKPASTKEPILALTGIRAVAAAWVLLLHGRRLVEMLFPASEVLRPLAARGYLGVDLFFVLSGFILAHNYGASKQPWSAAERRRFYWLRFARIYPVHLATLGVVVAGASAAHLVGRRYDDPATLDPRDLIPNLLLAHAWLWSSHASWNAPSWSISAEWAGYLVFPFLAPLLARIRSTALAATGALVALATTFAVLRLAGATSLDVTTRGGLVRLLGELVAGILLQRVYVHLLGTPAARYAGWVGAMAVGLALALRAPDEVVVLALAAFLVGIAVDRGWFLRILGSRPAVFAGERSYSLYMTHGIVLHLLESALPRAPLQSSLLHRASWLAIGIAGVLVATELTTRFVEEPARVWMRRLGERRRAMPALAA